MASLSLVDAAFSEPISATYRIHLFCRNVELDLKQVYADAIGRVSIRTLRLRETEFLLGAVHLPSKVNWNRADQAAEANVLAGQIREEENRRGHCRTILVGDFNMNPFEDGLIQASGLHAMSTRAGVAQGNRIVQGRSYTYFYNPMWSFFR